MLTDVSLPEQERQFEAKQVTSLLETAETVKEIALNRARDLMSPRKRSDEVADLLARRPFVDYFQYNLAIEVAKVIARHDQHIQAIHLFEESTNPDAQTEAFQVAPDLTIHLLALVSSTSAALESFVAALDRTLTEVLNELPSEGFAKRTSFLNVLAITEKDIQDGRGYAALLTSIHARPVKIWQRD